jgi:hypothetical protein
VLVVERKKFDKTWSERECVISHCNQPYVGPVVERKKMIRVCDLSL